MNQKSKRPKTKKSSVRKKTKPSKVKKQAKKIIKSITKPASKILKESIISAKKPTDIQLLEQFFGGSSKMRLWKIFTLNSTRQFTLRELVKLTKSKSDTLIPDLREFMRKGVIQAIRKQDLEKDKKVKCIVYSLVHDFPLLPEITQMILTAIPRSGEKVLAQLLPLQRLKAVLLSGFFTSKLGIGAQSSSSTSQSSIDMLLVFDKLPSNILPVINELEHHLGRELRYAALDQDDFKYRHSIGDKLIRDVLDFEHQVVMDKMGFFK